MEKKTFFQFCMTPIILKNAFKTSLIVGVLLALINHYEDILSATLSTTHILQIIVTFFIPFFVAMYSGAKYAQQDERMRIDSM